MSECNASMEAKLDDLRREFEQTNAAFQASLSRLRKDIDQCERNIRRRTLAGALRDSTTGYSTLDHARAADRLLTDIDNEPRRSVRVGADQ